VNVLADSFEDSVRFDFQQACLELAEAERALRLRNDATTQARLDRCRARVDQILDMWNEAASRRG